MSAMLDPAFDEMDDSRKGEAESLISAITEALEDDPDCSAGFVNEFGDFTIAIPLNGNQKALDAFIEKQKLFQYLADLAERFTAYVREKGSEEITCGFVGFDKEEASWISSDDESVHRLRETLKSLVDNLSMRGVNRCLIGGTHGVEHLVSDVVQESNDYLNTTKNWDGVAEGWKPAETEALPASSEGDEALIDRADMFVVLACGDGDFAEEIRRSKSLELLTDNRTREKPAIVFWTNWFETDWPNAGKIGILQPTRMFLQLFDQDDCL